MPKPFHKYKLLLDEHLPPRQLLPRLNAHFDVKHITHDLHHGGMADKHGQLRGLTPNSLHFLCSNVPIISGDGIVHLQQRT